MTTETQTQQPQSMDGLIQVVRETKELAKDLLNNYPAAHVIFALAAASNEDLDLDLVSAIMGISKKRIKWHNLEWMMKKNKCIWVTKSGKIKYTPENCDSALAIMLGGLMRKGAYMIDLTKKPPHVVYQQKQAASVLIREGIAMIGYRGRDAITIVPNPYFYNKIMQLLASINYIKAYLDNMQSKLIS